MKKGLNLSLIFLLLSLTSLAHGAQLKFTTQDFAPFSYEIDGTVSGPLVEIITEVCKEMKIDCSFQLMPWARAQKEVKDGEANGLFVIGWNRERSEWLYFSPPILNTEYGFFVLNDNPLEFKQVSDIKGYTIGVYGPSNTSVSLGKIKSEIGDLKIDIRPNDESGFKKLSLGRVDAVYSNRDVGYALIKKLGLKNIRYAGKKEKQTYFIGFSKQHNDKQVIKRFNETLRTLQQQGRIQAIIKQYFLEPAE